MLGSSGCGKTTLLKCILGRLQLAEGHITVMGRPPGSRGHKIPGSDVGYMPQVTIATDYAHYHVTSCIPFNLKNVIVIMYLS